MNKWEYIPNFKSTEFKCPCGCNNNPDMDFYLLIILQFIRNKYRKPVTITSGYRCQKYNDTLEGSIKNSDHIRLKAADFKIVGVTESVEKRKEIVESIKYFPGFKYAYFEGWIYKDGKWNPYKANFMGNSIHISVK